MKLATLRQLLHSQRERERGTEIERGTKRESETGTERARVGYGMRKSERETNEKAFKMSTRPQNIVCKMVEKGVQCVCCCLYVCVCMCECVSAVQTDDFCGCTK